MSDKHLLSVLLVGFAPVNRQARHEFWRSYRQRKLFWVAMRFLLAAVLVPLFAWLWMSF